MKILFKQFFKTFFKKNIFLIIGLGSLTTVLSFVISTAINISQSFDQSLNTLNSKSNKANVVGQDLDNFGRLDFSYDLNANEPLVKTYVSSLSLQKSANNEINRIVNTFFPYTIDELNMRKGKEFNKGVKVNPDYKSNPDCTLDGMFIFDDNLKIKAWDFNYGLSVLPPLVNTYNNKTAISLSFVNDQNEIILNPQQLLFNKYGIPFALFSNGNIDYQYSLMVTFANINKNVPNSIYDQNGFGIPELIFNRATNDKNSLHNTISSYSINIADYNIWNNNQSFTNYVFSKFIKEVDVKPIKIKLNLENSYGPVLEFIKKDKNNFIKIFENIFPINISRNDNLKTNTSAIDNISISSNNDYAITLALTDDFFVNPLFVVDHNSSLNPQEQIKNDILNNKRIFLSNFTNFLNYSFVSEAKKIFLNELNVYLQKNNIDMIKQKEYFYSNAESDNEYLFIQKNPDDQFDKLYISEGSDLIVDQNLNQILNNLNTVYNNKRSRKTFYAFWNLMDLYPESSLPKKDKKIPTNLLSSKYYMYYLAKYSLAKIIDLLNTLPTDEITNEIYDNQFMKLFTKLTDRFILKLNTNNISSEFNFEGSFTPLVFVTNIAIPYFYNYLCVVNDVYALENKKKYLPITTSQEIKDIWRKKIEELNNITNQDNQLNEFTNWIETIKNSSTMCLSFDFITEIFKENYNFFYIWLAQLPDDYKIKYNETSFLINGFGASSDFTYPVISPTNPIPTPKNQGLVFISESTFNSLNIADVNIKSYYVFGSNQIQPQAIVDLVKNYCLGSIKSNPFNVKLLDDAQEYGSVFIRTYFPNQIRNIVIIISSLVSLVLVILSIVVIYLLLSSFIKNLLEPISLTIANGFSLKKIILAAIGNLSILTIISNMIGFIAAYFSQSAFINLFSSIWMVPATIPLGFSPLIFLPLILITILIFGGIFSLLLYKQFKHPIPEIINNKNNVKNNLLTNFIRSSKLRIPIMIKLAIGFSSINIGRLSLLGFLGAASLGLIVSGIVINEKFITSQKNTNISRNYQYEYDLFDVNESTGLYKPQKFSYLGYEDQSVGIKSLYLNHQQHIVEQNKNPASVAPYYKEMFKIKYIPKKLGNENDIQIKKIDGKEQYLSNMIYPSWYIYQKIVGQKADSFFNGCASIFLLDISFDFLKQKINVWEIVRSNFPTWLVNQLEKQALNFQNYIMNYYGEWYYKFIELNPNEDPNLKFEIIPSSGNKLNINNFDNSKVGMYLAFDKTNNNIITKPYYVWPANKNGETYQIYASTPNAFNSTTLFSKNESKSLEFNLQNDFWKYNKWTDSLVKNEKPLKLENIEWVFFPAFNSYHELNPKKVSKPNADPNKIRYSDPFIDFICVLYNDELLINNQEPISNQDSKISFGIIPFDKEYDQTFSLVKGNISNLYDEFNNEYVPKVKNISLTGVNIDDQNQFIVLENDHKNISNLISKPSNNLNEPINVIINNGSSISYKLKVGSTFNLDVTNNSLFKSYELMHNIIGLSNNSNQSIPSLPKTSWKFKVVGINDDSFGNKFYINQKDANVILGLDKMPIYEEILPAPKIKNSQLSFTPFNGIFSKKEELLISKKSIPFYTFANIWNTVTSINKLTSKIYNNEQLFDILLSHDENVLKRLAYLINDKFGNKVNIDNNIDQLRKNILDFLVSSYSFSSALQAIDSLNQNTVLIPSLNSANSLSITNQMFDIISSLSTTVIISSVSVAIPLLLLVCLVISLSIINDLNKNIGLMKIMGYSNRNVLLTIAMMFIPVLLITILFGLGIMFALTYGLQYLIFSLTSIFITSYVNPLVFGIGSIIVFVILCLSLTLIAFILHKKTLEYSIKF